MAETGAVTWNFESRGQVTIPKGEISEDDIFEKAIEAGAKDLDSEEDVFLITTDPQELHDVVEALEGMGLQAEEAKLTLLAKTTLQVAGKDAKAVLRLMEALEDHDDVQDIFSNFDISDEEMAAVMGG